MYVRTYVHHWDRYIHIYVYLYIYTTSFPTAYWMNTSLWCVWTDRERAWEQNTGTDRLDSAHLLTCFWPWILNMVGIDRIREAGWSIESEITLFLLCGLRGRTRHHVPFPPPTSVLAGYQVIQRSFRPPPRATNKHCFPAPMSFLFYCYLSTSPSPCPHYRLPAEAFLLSLPGLAAL